MSNKYKTAQNPLLLRCHRLMEAFAKSDDERDFYLDHVEGFIVFVDLNKGEPELDVLLKEIAQHHDRYHLIPKLTFFETKKIMEGFINEKVYDIDTKEKLLDIIQSKEARENFLEFLYDHESELDKWQQYYQERSRVRIIEWLRHCQLKFVFEEDLDIPKLIVEKVKKCLFDAKPGKEVITARQALNSKAEVYYSNEALNPRPKRGRPPKQVIKIEIEPQFTSDFYITVPAPVRPFLFTPDITSISSMTFSAKFDTEEEFLASMRNTPRPSTTHSKLESLSQKLESLRTLSQQIVHTKESSRKPSAPRTDFDASARMKKPLPPSTPNASPSTPKASFNHTKVPVKAKVATTPTKAPTKTPTKTPAKTPAKAPAKKAAAQPVKKRGRPPAEHMARMRPLPKSKASKKKGLK